MNYTITCPYCLSTFSHEEVMFRSETYYYDFNDMEKKLGFKEKELDFINDTNQRKDKEKKLTTAKKYISKKDTVYQEFWDRFDGNTTEEKISKLNCKPWELPIIGNSNGAVELKRDEDGFVEGAKDEFGKMTFSRVCPYCHNPLPGKFGKYLVKNISIIGTVGAGKTVYISQLLKKFEEYVSKVGLSAFATSDNEKAFVEKNRVEKGYQLPNSTKQESFSQPMFYDIVYSEKTKKIAKTIVIYDIAGENCRSAEGMNRFGTYVKKSDGIILLIDPNQINFVPVDKDTDVNNIDTPSIAINTLYKAFSGKEGEKCHVPMAVCLSKCDECFDILPPIASEEIQINTGSDANKFDAKSYNKLIMSSDGLSKSFERNAHELCQKLRDEYLVFNFFAISAIGCCCGKNAQNHYTPLNIPHPKRIEEPIFWMLKQFGIIKANAPISRPFRITNASRYKLIKRFFKKTYLEEEEPDFSENEGEAIRTVRQVWKNKKYIDWSEEFDALEIKRYGESEK